MRNKGVTAKAVTPFYKILPSILNANHWLNKSSFRPKLRAGFSAASNEILFDKTKFYIILEVVLKPHLMSDSCVAPRSGICGNSITLRCITDLFKIDAHPPEGVADCAFASACALLSNMI
jgi:hypothetical protein